jgi:hypothetical protein
MPQTLKNGLVDLCGLAAFGDPQAVSLRVCAFRRIDTNPTALPYRQEVAGSIPALAGLDRIRDRSPVGNSALGTCDVNVPGTTHTVRPTNSHRPLACSDWGAGATGVSIRFPDVSERDALQAPKKQEPAVSSGFSDRGAEI